MNRKEEVPFASLRLGGHSLSNVWNPFASNLPVIDGTMSLVGPATGTNRFYRLNAWRK